MHKLFFIFYLMSYIRLFFALDFPQVTDQAKVMENRIKTPSFKPLYLQVKELILERLRQRMWEPGDLLPSEAHLATELSVSQGTVRKALDELTSENLLRRSQGKGTFVSEHTAARSMFHFLNLVGSDGTKQIPVSRLLNVELRIGSEYEIEQLQLAPLSEVVSLTRLRVLQEQPAIFETVVLPARLVEGMEQIAEGIPNTLYHFYERHYGFSVTRANEKLRAIEATEAQANHLNVQPGSPLLSITRLAFSYDNNPVELRMSVCSTENHHYLSEMT